MLIQTEKKRVYLSQIKLTMDYDYETIINELEKETWINKSIQDDRPGISNPAWQYRWNLYIPKSKILLAIRNYLHSDDVHNKILETLYEDGNNFQGLWDLNIDAMRKFTRMGAYFQKDIPGYELGLHLDSRRLVAAGMIFLTKEDNPNISTYFYFEKDPRNELRMPTNFGDGWIQSNSWQCYHSGYNRSDSNRYSIMLSLTIPKPN